MVCQKWLNGRLKWMVYNGKSIYQWVMNGVPPCSSCDQRPAEFANPSAAEIEAPKGWQGALFSLQAAAKWSLRAMPGLKKGHNRLHEKLDRYIYAYLYVYNDPAASNATRIFASPCIRYIYLQIEHSWSLRAEIIASSVFSRNEHFLVLRCLGWIWIFQAYTFPWLFSWL